MGTAPATTADMSNKQPPKPAPKPRKVKILTAVYDYSAEEEDELSFQAGDMIYVLDSSDVDWWRARVKGKEGLVPSNLLENLSSSSSSSPLHDAAKRGNTGLLKECLDNKIPVNQTDPAGNTALHWASRAGEVDCVMLLLSVGQISVNKTNKLGDTPAILAALHGRSHCLDALLQADADPDIKNNEGKKLSSLARDPDVLVILKKWGIISGIENGFNAEEYQNE